MESHRNLVLLTILGLSLVTADVDGFLNVYYVKADNNSICPHNPCKTLTEYAQNVSAYFTSDTQIVFLPGLHTLKTNTSIHIVNVSQLSLKGDESLTAVTIPSNKCIIQCEGAAGFDFVNTSKLIIQSLTISNCGRPVEFAKRVYAALAFHSAFHLTISAVTVQNSSGYGIYASNALSSVHIVGSTFQFNSGTSDYKGGNIGFFYHKCSYHSAHLYIHNSHILYGYSSYPVSYLVRVATGISLWFECSNIQVNINHTRMIGNSASQQSAGGNLAIVYFNKTNVIQNHVHVDNSFIMNGRGQIGSGIFVYIYEHPISVNSSSTGKIYSEALFISNCQFIGNYATVEGAGLYIGLHEPMAFSHPPGIIFVSNCTFRSNTLSAYRDAGVAVHIVNHYSQGLLQNTPIQFNIIFVKCMFFNNILISSEDSGGQSSGSGVAFITQNPSNTSFIDCAFMNNAVTAIAAINSYLIFSGTITMKNNTGIDGGGIVLCERSYMFLTPHTNLIITDNHAVHSGGGIYAEHQCLESETICFYEFLEISPTIMETIHIELINNTAGYAGSALYGGSVDYCYVPNAPVDWTGQKIFEKVFKIKHFPEDQSYISSDPLHVCFCENGMPNCNKHTIEEDKFPGEMFQIAAVAVGQMKGTVPGVVVANSIKTSEVSLVPDLQVFQHVSNTCTFLNYTVFSNQSFETLYLTVQRPYFKQGIQRGLKSRLLNVSLKTCPLGFSLPHDQPYTCDCDPILKVKGIVCYINNQTIYRPAPNWIGYHFTENVSNSEDAGIIFCNVCPYDFCRQEQVSIEVSNKSFGEDKQCNFNRTGILCGACPEGLSVILGSSKCHRCSNLYLLLLIPFALTGLLLVIFLTVCNLTVSEGTINGLVFYANIVHTNSAISFSSTSKANPLAVFIYWLNLDLGIETCFYSGMDAYVKAWLQFAFPIYIWLIAGLIIILSHRFTTVTKMVGKNATKVLATLFLLSYAKLVHAIIAAFSGTVLTYPNGSEVRVWLSNGNLQYMKGKHLFLFVGAMVMLALILPYAILLLLLQCLQKLDWRILSWFRRLKPLFDAYTGPFKDKYRFWVGLLLLVRILPFVGSQFFGEHILQLIAFAALIVMALAWSFHGVYKKWPLNVLEASFVLNLGVSATATSILNHRNKQEVIAGISVGVAFITFIGVLVYHSYKKLRSTQMCQNLITWLRIQYQQSRPTPCEMGSPASPDHNQPRPLFVHFNEDREPLLAFEDTD